MHPNRFKVNLIGNTMVGKTTILNRVKTGDFVGDSISTVGASFVTLRHEGINFEIWDTAGQERYLALIPMYFRDVKIIIFVFDVNIKKSIKYINKYRDVIYDKQDVKIIILGNKTDLLEEKYSLEELTTEVYKNFEDLLLADKIHGLYFISAKNGNNFEKFLEHFYESAKTFPIDDITDNVNINNLYSSNNITIDKHEEIKISKCC